MTKHALCTISIAIVALALCAGCAHDTQTAQGITLHPVTPEPAVPMAQRATTAARDFFKVQVRDRFAASSEEEAAPKAKPAAPAAQASSVVLAKDESVPRYFPFQEASCDIVSHYGPRSGRQHKGIDLKGPMNAPVKATAAGVVTYSGGMSGYGNIVIIDHGDGLESRYAHLNSCKAPEGAKVAKGEVIGLLGQTGNASCPHVHYEVRMAGKAVDPIIFLPAEEPTMLTEAH